MKSLFAKIFVCFVLLQIAASLLMYAMLTATRPRDLRPRSRPEWRQNLPPDSNAGDLNSNQIPRNSNPGDLNLQSDNRNLTNRPRARFGERPPRRRIRPEDLETIRFVAILLAACAVSYGLARYISAPIGKLRKATQQLAAGDLSTRVAPQFGNRRDELADLGQDFDIMAERIGALLSTERRLLGDISHELRSPLARMQVALDLADQSADEETRSFLNRIEREGARLNDLIGQLLTLTRLETAAIEAQRETIDLPQLVSEVVADSNFEARGQDRAVRITRSDECSVAGNAELLRRAVENVVRNAVRYTRENSEVVVALRCEQGASTPEVNDQAQAIITVRDYGEGVPEDSLPKLFDPFYRVADARDRQSGGVGLGLSITARAVRFHGGQVQATNLPGGGLQIEIRLPIAKESRERI